MRKQLLSIITIFVIALLPRLLAINFGLPNLYLEDEEFFVQPAIRVAEGHWDPGEYGTPNHPYIYLMAGSFRVENAVINIGDAEKLRVSQQYSANPAPFHVLGRLWAVLAGSLLSVLLYLIGRRWSQRIGIIAGILAALNPFAVFHSHIIRPDILQTLFLAAALLFLLRILDTPQKRNNYILVGISFGLSITTKYPALFFLPIMLTTMAITAYHAQFQWRRWLTAVGATLATIFISTPALFIHFQKTWRAVLFENRSIHYGHDGLSPAGNAIWYLWRTMHWQIGTFLFIVTTGVLIIGVLLLARKKQWTAQATELTIVVAAIFIYIAGISLLSLHWERWLLPASTLYIVLTAWALDCIITRIRSRVFVVLLLVVLLFGPVARLFGTLKAFTRPDTRDTARKWIQSNISAPANFIGEPYTPQPGEGYSYKQYPNLSYRSIASYRQQGVTHFLTTDRVENVILNGVSEDHPDAIGINQLAKPKYENLRRHMIRLYTAVPNLHYSPKQLLESADWLVWRNFTHTLQYGPEVRIYQLLPKN